MATTRCRSVRRLLAAMALVAAAGPASAAGTLALQPCRPDLHPTPLCGHLDRPLDPGGTVPGTVAVHVEVYRHTRKDVAAAGTLLAVEGGPGYPSTGTRAAYLGLLRPLLDTRDLVLVDNRGTGRSQAVDCPALQYGTGAPTLAAIDACGRQLAETAPLYSTVQAADDLAAVLAALGSGPVDLYADSYGTWFSQVFAYRHPEWLRSMLLDSAYPVPQVGGETAWWPYFAPTMRAEFDTVCARSPTCAALPGRSMDHVQPALDALRAHPFDAQARDANHRLQHFRADASMLAGVMLAGAPPFTVARELDAAARAFAGGDRLPLLRLMAEAQVAQEPRIAHDDPRAYSEGLFWAVSCQDYAQIYDMTLPPPLRRAQRDLHVAERERRHPDTYAPFTIAEFRGMWLDYSLLDACVGWPAPAAAHPPGPPIPAGAVMPDIPVLVLSGEIDTITTPAEGAIVAGLFPRGRQVVVANRFHLTALPPQSDPCGLSIARRFLATHDAGDTGCADRVAPLRTPPAFARHASELPLPQALPGNAADDALLQAAAAAVHTLGDATARLESNTTGSAPALRGGGFRSHAVEGGFHLTLRDARWTEDVRVDGRFDWPWRAGSAIAHLRVRLADGRSGRLSVQWPEGVADAQAQLRGRFAGKDLRATMPAP